MSQSRPCTSLYPLDPPDATASNNSYQSWQSPSTVRRLERHNPAGEQSYLQRESRLRDWLRNKVSCSERPGAERLLILEYDPVLRRKMECRELFCHGEFTAPSSIVGPAVQSDDDLFLIAKWMSEPRSTLWMFQQYPKQYLLTASMTNWTEKNALKKFKWNVEDHYHFEAVDGLGLADVDSRTREYLCDETRLAVKRTMDTVVRGPFKTSRSRQRGAGTASQSSGQSLPTEDTPGFTITWTGPGVGANKEGDTLDSM